ncbi:MAG: hypothetical protein WCL00_02185 [Bacteroidota bacterium]
MKTYIFTHPKFEGKALFRFDDQGSFRAFELEGLLKEGQWGYFLENFPMTESMISLFASRCQGKIVKQADDLSFEKFWDSYGYKVGNKNRTRKLWDLLSEADRNLVLQSIPRYDNFLANKKNQDKTYPETYLAQRRFENTYKF